MIRRPWILAGRRTRRGDPGASFCAPDVEEGRDELALGRLGRVLLGELEGDLVDPAGPVGVLLPGDAALPLHEVGRPVALGFWPGVEAEGMVPAPVFALLIWTREGVCYVVPPY